MAMKSVPNPGAFGTSFASVAVAVGAVVLANPELVAEGAKLVRRFTGSSVLLVGPSGAGTSTLAKILETRSQHDAGDSVGDLVSHLGDIARLNAIESAGPSQGGMSRQDAIRELAPRSKVVCLVVSLAQLEDLEAVDGPMRLARQLDECTGRGARRVLVLTHLDKSEFSDAMAAKNDVRVSALARAFGTRVVVALSLVGPVDTGEAVTEILSALGASEVEESTS